MAGFGAPSGEQDFWPRYPRPLLCAGTFPLFTGMTVEVSILSHTGIPQDAVLSIRAGSARKQAAIGSGKPFRLPHLSVQESPVKIDIMQCIGTAYLCVKPGEERYQAVFQTGGCQPMVCELGVRPTPGEDSDRRDEPAPEASPCSEDAQQYLDRHGIVPFVQAVLQTVIKERPEDPFKHVARHCTCGYEFLRRAKLHSQDSIQSSRPPCSTRAPSTTCGGLEIASAGTATPPEARSFPGAPQDCCEAELAASSDGESADLPAKGDEDEAADSPLERPPLSAGKRPSIFWQAQLKGRPRRLIFIRDGESEGNVDRTIFQRVPDHKLHLTASGRRQALDAGARLQTLVGEETVKIVVSPYVRTRETLNGILRSWGGTAVKVTEDVRIRQQEFGNFDAPHMDELKAEKSSFGAFYYRFPNGESPADCYDRASSFLETMYRSWQVNEAENQIIVGHGLMILVTLMRMFKLPVEAFERMEKMTGCEFVVLERPADDAKFRISFTWQGGQARNYDGLRLKAPTSQRISRWTGEPGSPLRRSVPAARRRVESGP